MKVKDIIASLKKLGPEVDVSNIKAKFTYPNYDSDSDPDDYDDDEFEGTGRKMTGVEVTLSLQPPEPEETDDDDENDEPFFDKLKGATGRGRRNR